MAFNAGEDVLATANEAATSAHTAALAAAEVLGTWEGEAQVSLSNPTVAAAAFYDASFKLDVTPTSSLFVVA